MGRGQPRGLQKSAQGLTGIVDDLRSTVEGSELSDGATVLVHGLVSRGDLNSQMGLLGRYDEARGRWAVSFGGRQCLDQGGESLGYRRAEGEDEHG